MKKTHPAKRILSLLLVFAMIFALYMPARAASGANDSKASFKKVDTTVSADLSKRVAETAEEEPAYGPKEKVRVSIVLEDKPTVQAGYAIEGIAQNQAAVAYRDKLEDKQESMAQQISKQALGGAKLDVVWNLTLAANLISANVEYGQIEKIKQVSGVDTVYIEPVYEPDVVSGGSADVNMLPSSHMIGSPIAWDSGYTGAGSRIAIIDTGLDTDHQSFDPGALEYALRENAEYMGMTYEEYIESLDLLDAQEIAGVLDQLNSYKRTSSLTGEQLYRNTKLAYAYNYVDRDLDVTHDHDSEGDHGSHVSGIATSNRYVPDGNGGYASAAETVKVNGVAPDAQILTMKVFGKGGGAYASDYMVAIEDALVLGCDSVNLSLGSPNPGFTYDSTSYYNELFDSLNETGTVVVFSAGNYGRWSQSATNPTGHLYGDDVNFFTGGSPGSMLDAFTVASVDNAGFTGAPLEINGKEYTYSESNYSNEHMYTLANSDEGTEYDYVFFTGIGEPADYAGIDVTGKVVLVSRGTTSFYEKHDAAGNAGAAAVIIYNNQAGDLNMDLSDSTSTIPCVSMSQAAAQAIQQDSTLQDNGTYTGKVTIYPLLVKYGDGNPYTMSDFSAWGTSGALTIKPEITAPGGNIYSSVNNGDYGMNSGTSMSAPQITGMVAVVAQYLRDNGRVPDGVTARAMAMSLLMSTAVPMTEEESGELYSILRQGSGLANVGKAVSADSYISMDDRDDGKVKAELGDDPARTGEYHIAFTVHNMATRVQTYKLDATTLTQNLFEDYANSQQTERCNYLDALTTKLEADVAYKVNGNTSSGTFRLPANGQAKVEVTITLPAEVKAYLDENYVNGAYIEGYLYVMPGTTQEGAVGVTHSIPFLGFYGSWTDSSMFDVGTYAERYYGTEVRDSYIGVDKTNFLTVNYAGDSSSYYYMGNPLLEEDEYLPQRNAFNNQVGNKFAQMVYSPIRNASGTRLVITNAETGEIYYESISTSQVIGAYYHGNNAVWTNTTRQANVNWAGTDATGAKLPEGTKVNISLGLAPEYYRNEDGSVNWEALGDGAYLTTQTTIDNTAPELEDITFSIMRKMVVTAKDNNYIAGVVVYNASGTKALGTYSPNETVPGETQTATFDLKDVKGSRFLVAVYDYAMNETTYEVNVGGGEEEETHEFTAFDTDLNAWVGFDVGATEEEIETLATSSATFFSGAYVDGYIFAGTDTGDLYVMKEDALSAPTFICSMGVVITDMAYNPVDGVLYGVNSGNLYAIDKLMGTVTQVGSMGHNANTLTCDDKGNFYFLDYNTCELYTFTLESLTTDASKYDMNGDQQFDEADAQYLLDYVAGVQTTLAADGDINGDGSITSYDAYRLLGILDEGLAPVKLVGPTGYQMNYVQSIAWSPNDGNIYWAQYHYASYVETKGLVKINPETGAAVKVGELRMESTALIVNPRKGGGGWYDPTTEIGSMEISEEQMNLIVGSSKTLQVNIMPWTVKDRTVKWSSSDPNVATVDANGLVTAVSGGACTITATAKIDPSKSVSCEVTCETVDFTLKGALQDAEGNSKFFDWNLETEKTWTPGTEIDTSLASVTYDKRSDVLFVQDANENVWASHKVDMMTGTSLETSGASEFGMAMSDMASMEYFGTAEAPLAAGVYGGYLLSPTDPMENNFTTGWNMGLYLMIYTNASRYVAVASGGVVEGDEEGTYTDFIYALDDGGSLWVFWYDGTSSIDFNYFPTDLTLDFPTNENYQYCSLVEDHESGILFLSYYTGQTNEVYMLMFNGTSFESTYLGNFGQDVWPACLYAAEPNAAAPAGVSVKDMRPAEIMTVDAVPVTPEALSGLQSQTAAPAKADVNVNTPDGVAAPQDVSYDDAAKTVTLEIPATEATTNGMMSFSYDKEALTLSKVESTVQLNAANLANGNFAYAALNPVEKENILVTLTFTCTEKAGDTAKITVKTTERNDKAVSETEVYEVGLDHNWNDWETVTEPTCTEEGLERRTCKDCDAEETRAIPALGHDYEVEVVPPTCTVDGYTEHTCKVCGYSFRDQYTKAAGHKTELRNQKEATCSEAGYTGDLVCTICGEIVERGQIIPALEHEWGAWTEIQKPDCTHAGREERTCSVCGEKETRPIPATGHNYVDTVVPPTCTTDGYTLHTCKICGYNYRDNYVPSLGHDFQPVVTDPTCTEMGYTTYTCSRCGNAYVADMVPALGHKWGDWVVIQEPDCDNEGVEERTCSVCGEKETRPIPVTAHNYVDTVVPPTCTEKGYTTRTCDHCGDSYVVDVVPALGHKWGEWTMAKAATCFKDGEETRTCPVCQELESRAIPANRDACPSKQFVDVNQDLWYHQGVDYVLESGLMIGTSDTTFSPSGVLNRGQMMVILYRLAGDPEVAAQMPFTDLQANAYYANAVAWAYEAGIAKGVSETRFAPNEAVSREQLVTFLARYTEWSGHTVKAEGDLSAYTDAARVGSYAEVSIIWAVEKGLIDGTEENVLSPQSSATRAQTATVLLRYCTGF